MLVSSHPRSIRSAGFSLIELMIAVVIFAFLVMIVVSVQLGRGNSSTEIAKGWHGLPGAVQDIVMGTVTGVISSAIFWMVGIWRTGLEHGRLNTLLESTRLAAVEAPRPLADTFPGSAPTARHLQ